MMRFWMRLAVSAAWIVAFSAALAPDERRHAAAADAGEAAAAAVSREQIDDWIAGLGATGFVEREDAMAALIEAGPAAIEPLAKALPQADLEATTRGIYVLRELALSGDEAAEEQARAALTALSSGRARSAAASAAATLAHLDELRQKRSLEALEQLGAEVEYAPQAQIGLHFEFDVTTVRIGPDFRGGSKDLEQLKWLGNVQKLTLEGEKITDASLAGVSGMSRLQELAVKRARITDKGLDAITRLENLRAIDIFYSPVGDGALDRLKGFQGAELIRLYGTKVSKPAAEKLAQALANTKVDCRSGGFLGVHCQAHPLGCGVALVHPGSAASKADIRDGDVITRYQDKRIQDFEELTRLIGENVAGDTVKVEIWRDGEKLEKELKLGEWE